VSRPLNRASIPPHRPGSGGLRRTRQISTRAASSSAMHSRARWATSASRSARDVGQPGWRQAPQITKELHAPHWHGRGGVSWHWEAPVVVEPRSLSAGRQEGVRGWARGRCGRAIGPNLAGCRGGSGCVVIAGSRLRSARVSSSVRSSHISPRLGINLHGAFVLGTGLSIALQRAIICSARQPDRYADSL